MPHLSAQAINAALNSNWEQAIKLNKDILESNPSDLDALNRLGYAYLNCANSKKAKTVLKKVLKLDPFNAIATKNLKKLNGIITKNDVKNNRSISPRVFLEEPGITKTVNLVHLASKSILSHLYCGLEVLFITKKNRVEIRLNDSYLGALPDDLSFRLRKLTKLGNVYRAFIKAVNESQLTIIIREIKRGKRVKDASFTVKLLPEYHSSIRPDLLSELLEEDVSTKSAFDRPTDDAVEEDEE